MKTPPQYKNAPLSAIVPIPKEIKPGYPLLWLWADLWGQTTRPYDAGEAARLASDGWKRQDNISILQGQLYHIRRFTHETEERIKEGWYQAEEGEPAPVVLALTVPAHVPATPIYMLNPLPLPQHGEYALVTEPGAEEVTPYYILELSLEARQRWAALNDAITRLSEPLKWPLYTERHKLASDEIAYHNELHSLNVRRQLAIGTTKDELVIQAISLEAAHMHVEELRKALLQPDWLQQWQEVQRMARQLAYDYYDHHQAAKGQRDVQEDTSAQQEAPTEKKKSRRHQAVTPIVAKGQSTIQHKSDAVNWEIISSLRDKSIYTHYPDLTVAEHRHTFMKEKGQIIISIGAQQEEGWETVISALNTLGDGCIDTYIAVMAMAIEQNGTDGDRLRLSIMVNPDDILAICGKEKSHGSYTPFQRAEIVKHLKTLSQTKIIVTMPGQPGKVKKKRGPRRKGAPNDDGTVVRAEGALIDLLSFKLGEYNTITGEEIWEKRSISVGPWAKMIPGINTQTAIMFRQLLAYSAKNERYQKRIGLYLTQMFRVNARHQGQFPHGISMSALLEGAGIVPPRQQGEFRESLEKAIGQLKRDGVIGEYWRIVESAPEPERIQQAIEQHAKGWFDYYLRQKWNFAPPPTVLNQYRNIMKAPGKQEEAET
jgi:hypothetical protein